MSERTRVANPSSRSHSPARHTSSLDLSKTRAHTACKACRSKKIKCIPGPEAQASTSTANSNQPRPCSDCIQTGIASTCTYPVSKDRAAFTRQYVQNLEGRVQSLEELCAKLTPLLDELPSSSRKRRRDVSRSSREPTGDLAEGHDELPQTWSRGRESEISRRDLGQWTRDELGNPRWLGSHNTLSILDALSPESSLRTAEVGIPTTTVPRQIGGHHHLADHNAIYFAPVAGSGRVNRLLPGLDRLVFPDEHSASAMIDAFYAEVHPLLPVVPEHRFRQAYTRLTERRKRGETFEFNGFISTLFAIFALGERVLVNTTAWNRGRSKLHHGTGSGRGTSPTVLPGEAEAGQLWFESAQLLHYTTQKDVSHHQVQCLTLLAAFEASVNAMPRAWLLATQAMRVAQDLGLHRASAHDAATFHQKQIRSRNWWAVYGMERLLSLSLGRPLGVEDVDIDVPYPVPIDDDGLRRVDELGIAEPDVEHLHEPHNSTMSGFVALTKLCRIAGKVSHLLHRHSTDNEHFATQVDRLDNMLSKWLATELPSKYKPSASSRPIQLMTAVLSNSYHAVLITLHRVFFPNPRNNPRPAALPLTNKRSLKQCLSAARSVIRTAEVQDVLVPPSHHLAVTCQYLWSSAIILLISKVHAEDQASMDAVGPLVESCRRSLHVLEPVWPGSGKLKLLLLDAIGRANGSDNAPNPLAATSTASYSSTADNSFEYPQTARASNSEGPLQPQPLPVPSLQPTVPSLDGMELLQSFFTGTGLDAAAFWANLEQPASQTRVDDPDYLAPYNQAATGTFADNSSIAWTAAPPIPPMNIAATHNQNMPWQPGSLDFDWMDDSSMPFIN